MSESSLNKYLPKTASGDKWKRTGLRKRAGVLVPLLSVYSRQSLGIGEFTDLKLLIDWANQTSNSIIQLLPMNEVGSIFCPYDSVSSFALEPVYLSLGLLPQTKKDSIQVKIENIKKMFPAGIAYVNYRIKKEKVCLLWDIFLEEGNHNSLEFKKFKEENIYWLDDFALFKVIKEEQGGKAWYEWEDKYKDHDKLALENFQKEHEREITFQMWIQWLTFKQFKDAKNYAEVKKVLIKGDLPILVSRDSADAWAHPEFFKLDFAAGAPPDMYCAKGQRWGMPTYNWEKISADGFRYLKEKLKYAENFYDILRIDHVVGLFRIWSIPYSEPLDNQGLNGFFDPKDEKRWREHGRNILTVMLNNTNILLCAEDLGTIPKVCTDTLKDLGIPGNDVQRWVKDWKVKHDFLKPKDYRALSVAMLSTHDTTNWPAWWENEAGTVDEALFIRKCSDHRKIDYNNVKGKLFDTFGSVHTPPFRAGKDYAALSINPEANPGLQPEVIRRVDLNLSGHGRLRWLNSIDSIEKLVSILGKKKEEVKDFIDMYENTYKEKDKLWRHLKIHGPMREKSDSGIVRAALKISLESSTIFCINTIIDWLYLTDILKGDPYQYRINTPATISEKNWSLTIPLSLEELLKHKVTGEIKKMVGKSGRA